MEPADDTGPAVDLSPHWHVQVGLRDPTSVASLTSSSSIVSGLRHSSCLEAMCSCGFCKQAGSRACLVMAKSTPPSLGSARHVA